ncbi:MAG: YggT family protein [Coriobacteriia bacterium]
MPTMSTSSADRRRHAHTEIRSPIEVTLSHIVFYVFGVIEVLIAIRFVFGMFGANTAAPFVRLINSMTEVFMVPFTAIFRTQQVDGATFEWSVLVALVIYALIAWGLVALIHAVSPRSHASTIETTETVERDEDRFPG